MPALSRRIVLPLAAVAVLTLGGGGWMAFSQAQAKKAEAAKASAKAVPLSPYLAVANGKADVEGGMIQVAARRSGIVREVLVQEGDQVTKGQILARGAYGYSYLLLPQWLAPARWCRGTMHRCCGPCRVAACRRACCCCA